MRVWLDEKRCRSTRPVSLAFDVNLASAPALFGGSPARGFEGEPQPLQDRHLRPDARGNVVREDSLTGIRQDGEDTLVVGRGIVVEPLDAGVIDARDATRRGEDDAVQLSFGDDRVQRSDNTASSVSHSKSVLAPFVGRRQPRHHLVEFVKKFFPGRIANSVERHLSLRLRRSALLGGKRLIPPDRAFVVTAGVIAFRQF